MPSFSSGKGSAEAMARVAVGVLVGTGVSLGVSVASELGRGVGVSTIMITGDRLRLTTRRKSGPTNAVIRVVAIAIFNASDCLDHQLYIVCLLHCSAVAHEIMYAEIILAGYWADDEEDSSGSNMGNPDGWTSYFPLHRVKSSRGISLPYTFNLPKPKRRGWVNHH
jgi:hypothetical protein